MKDFEKMADQLAVKQMSRGHVGLYTPNTRSPAPPEWSAANIIRVAEDRKSSTPSQVYASVKESSEKGTILKRNETEGTIEQRPETGGPFNTIGSGDGQFTERGVMESARFDLERADKEQLTKNNHCSQINILGDGVLDTNQDR